MWSEGPVRYTQDGGVINAIARGVDRDGTTRWFAGLANLDPDIPSADTLDRLRISMRDGMGDAVAQYGITWSEPYVD